MRLSYLVAVQNYTVMAPEIEFSLLHGRHDRFVVSTLFENAERQHEYRIVGRDRCQAVVAALIDVDYVITEGHA